MKLEDKIVPRCITLTGYNNAVEQTSGEITLPVLAGGVTLEITFHIMDQDTTYNAIIWRPRDKEKEAYQPTWSRLVGDDIKDVIRDPDVDGAAGPTIEDLDLVQLDVNDYNKKAYIGCKLTSHAAMPGIPKDIATHTLSVDPLYPPVRQVRRKFNPAINNAVREKVEKLLENGSIRESKYPQWVANIVMVKKKNDKWR
uniref:Uncharacterized protein n=1 Tax=Nicotiana tabacum TaxID=4097 RepID=A0A1S3X9Z0_TOBAC